MAMGRVNLGNGAAKSVKKMRGGGMVKKARGGGMTKKMRGGGMVKKLDKGGPSKTDEDKNQENYDKAIRKIAKQNKKGKK